jgi:uncharacterized membrane protein
MKTIIKIMRWMNVGVGALCLIVGIMFREWQLCLAGSFFFFFAAVACPWMLHVFEDKSS